MKKLLTHKKYWVISAQLIRHKPLVPRGLVVNILSVSTNHLRYDFRPFPEFDNYIGRSIISLWGIFDKTRGALKQTQRGTKLVGAG